MNDIKWQKNAIDRVIVHYVHRGAPGDERAAKGTDIVDIGASFLELRSVGPMPAMIPYHRILRIEVDGALVWERRAPERS